MYMFSAASNATSAGSQRPASVAGPPSPSCPPPSPATVVSSGFGFEASSGPPIAPQPASTVIDMVENNSMGVSWEDPPSVRGGVRCVKPNSQRPFISNILTIFPTEGTAHHSNELVNLSCPLQTLNREG